MLSHHLHVELATARTNDLIAEARAARLAREARHHRVRTRRRFDPIRRGRAGGPVRGPARTVPCVPETTSERSAARPSSTPCHAGR
jgi:hypothetical protein